MKRRDFLATLSFPLAAAAKPLDSVISLKGEASSKMSSPAQPFPQPVSNGLEFASAREAADAIRQKKISSLELTRLMFARIDRYNPRLNAFAYQLREDALAQARKADEAQAQGKSLGVFHGVPINVKESFAVAGHPCTWGIPQLKDSKAPQDSEVVARLENAGAILTAATNVPVNLSDWQTYNPIYGTTNNPWDVTRTPGGSSGGTAASLAAGLAYLSVGSDIGGSIRVPAHFCGIYGHKPTLDLVSVSGHQPGGQPSEPGFSTLLAVAGPIARSASDLLAALKILAGPISWDAKAWHWNLPAPRAQNLRDFRVGYVFDDPFAPLTPDSRAVFDKTLEALQSSGAKLKPGWPQNFHLPELYDAYIFMLAAFTYSVAPPPEQEAYRRQYAANPHSIMAPGSLSTYADWQQRNFRRVGYRAQWQAYFHDVDVFLSPAAFTPAFPHDHSKPQEKRQIPTSTGPRPYYDMFKWIVTSTLTGCPSTVAPIGRTSAGLPVGLQIMGPFWEDGTPIAFAEALAREIGGFIPPPGFTD